MIASVAGELKDGRLVRTRPFRAPHHSASMPALVGGGLKVRPGEVSLAHLGVLFLDELPEFQRVVLDSLRQPLESGVVHVARANAHVTYPGRVQFVAAMNPCRRVAFLMPGVLAQLRASKPEVVRDEGDDLASRLSRRRRELGLFQKDAAKLLGACKEAIMKWERGISEPVVRYYPAIIDFLGYEPWPKPQTDAERILAARRRRGWTQAETAKELGVDESALWAWESGKRPVNRRMRGRLQLLFEAQ